MTRQRTCWRTRRAHSTRSLRSRGSREVRRGVGQRSAMGGRFLASVEECTGCVDTSCIGLMISITWSYHASGMRECCARNRGYAERGGCEGSDVRGLNRRKTGWQRATGGILMIRVEQRAQPARPLLIRTHAQLCTRQPGFIDGSDAPARDIPAGRTEEDRRTGRLVSATAPPAGVAGETRKREKKWGTACG